ncbi:MlaD family protein [Caballeronia mineralivorans]|jgi:phospholipid/cholesterol/gamma-HCH transport system substrate-binding protein|uniref:MlaD family protein n=1 Tax=Caballeronia mineralivorans TaxID=2010198 RepID=UPI0023F16BF5|nr:MlaD family protein [Caballeronia mineralivorans]MDB5789906.1 Mce related family protein [Caballeronia mineralivorans]MEA3103441.1 phospholipid/cholesterol/gamma-HCH transport system substrate-binding protein [Caballeronia mineralivorans]
MRNDINTKARFAFVAFLLVSTVAGAVWYFFSGSQYATYQIYTQDSVSGLIADAPVEFHGVEVGKVKSVRLVNSHSVGIVVSIEKTAPVTSASVATITSRGLATRGFTGYVYISLEDVGINSRPLTTRPGEPYPIIPTAPSKVVTLDTTINQVNENFQVMTELLKSILDTKTIASLKQSADSLQQVTTALAENTNKLNSIVANTERASRRFKPLLQSSDDAVRALQTQILPQAHSLLQSSDDTVSALQTQILPEAHKALFNLDNLSSSFTDLATKINRDPSIVIRGTAQRPLGPGEGK